MTTIAIESSPRRVRVSFNGRTIADTDRALTLREGSYPPVLYVPREDADMTLLRRTARTTRCPYKGEASYYTIAADGRTADNAVWSYETPVESVAAIRGYLAFYPDRVEISEEPA